jgi:Pentapeptide repeats (8 copies)
MPAERSRVTRGILAGALALACGAIAVALVWIVPAALTRHPIVHGSDRLKAISDARTGVVALAAGAAALGGLIYTSNTYRLSRKGQVADRYTKAVEQLGHANSSVRVGGLFALDQLARDSTKDYRETAIEVVAAYIRDRAPWPPNRPSRLTAARHRIANAQQPVAVPTPEPDVQLALGILRGLVHLAQRKNLDLRNTNLANAELSGTYLLDARLGGANLVGARLNGADLGGADLRGAAVEGAQMDLANLTDAQLTRGTEADDAIRGATGIDGIQWFDS